MPDKWIKLEKGAAVMLCDDGPRHSVVVSGRTVYFTWSEMFGPCPETYDGRPRDLPHNHPFWGAATAWNRRRAKENPA